jgi:hypothetical protein
MPTVAPTRFSVATDSHKLPVGVRHYHLKLRSTDSLKRLFDIHDRPYWEVLTFQPGVHFLHLHGFGKAPVSLNSCAYSRLNEDDKGMHQECRRGIAKYQGNT